MIYSNNINILKELFSLLKRRQKINLIFITAILAITAILSQLTPIMIGRLTDAVLKAKGLSFSAIIPYLLIILIVNIVNERLERISCQSSYEERDIAKPVQML